jgi:hypothetical protein
MKSCFTALLFSLFSFSAFGQEKAPSSQRVGAIKLDKDVEKAISEGLAYLAKTQNPKTGAWDSNHPVADTSLALMAFMLQGHVPERGIYGDTMEAAINYIIKVGKDGNRGYLGTPSHHGGMYEHGLAILALSEAWGQSTNRDLGHTLKRAVDVTIRAQNTRDLGEGRVGGGWRYNPEPRDADLSMTVMHTVALNSAKEAGIAVPDATLDKAKNYVLYCQEETSGGFGYSGPSGPGFARTAAGVMSLLMCGVDRNHQAIRRGMSFLKEAPEEKFTGGSHFLYANYYAIQCMYQTNTAEFNKYYGKIKYSLMAPNRLKSDGNGQYWSIKEGNTYSTAMAILILGVPYRFLPIYQR